MVNECSGYIPTLYVYLGKLIITITIS